MPQVFDVETRKVVREIKREDVEPKYMTADRAGNLLILCGGRPRIVVYAAGTCDWVTEFTLELPKRAMVEHICVDDHGCILVLVIGSLHFFGFTADDGASVGTVAREPMLLVPEPVFGF